MKSITKKIQFDLDIKNVPEDTEIEVTFNGIASKDTRKVTFEHVKEAILSRNSKYRSLFMSWYQHVDMNTKSMSYLELLSAAIEASYPPAVEDMLYFLYSPKTHPLQVNDIWGKIYSIDWLSFGRKLNLDQKLPYQKLLKIALDKKDYRSASYFFMFGIAPETPEILAEDKDKTGIHNYTSEELCNKIKLISDRRHSEHKELKNKKWWGDLWNHTNNTNSLILVGSIAGLFLTAFSGAILVEASQTAILYSFYGFTGLLGISLITLIVAFVGKAISDKIYDNRIGSEPTEKTQGYGLLKEIADIEKSISGENGAITVLEQKIKDHTPPQKVEKYNLEVTAKGKLKLTLQVDKPNGQCLKKEEKQLEVNS